MMSRLKASSHPYLHGQNSQIQNTYPGTALFCLNVESLIFVTLAEAGQVQFDFTPAVTRRLAFHEIAAAFLMP